MRVAVSSSGSCVLDVYCIISLCSSMLVCLERLFMLAFILVCHSVCFFVLQGDNVRRCVFMRARLW